VTLSRHTTALLALAAACIGLAGCGDEDTGDPIPRDKVAAMEQQLDAVQQAADGSRCEDVGPAVSELQTQIATLDENGVGDDVQDALGDGADNLRSIASDSCEPEETETTPETTPETTVTPPPTETTPPTDTTPPPTETTPPPPEEEPEEPIEPPADEDDGGGQFDPSGGGAVPPGQSKKGDED
jgi:hypothetical protein